LSYRCDLALALYALSASLAEASAENDRAARTNQRRLFERLGDETVGHRKNNHVRGSGNLCGRRYGFDSVQNLSRRVHTPDLTPEPEPTQVMENARAVLFRIGRKSDNRDRFWFQ
jgi:hypothetical protein